jgi:MYXO-CTERM domain-containing protein
MTPLRPSAAWVPDRGEVIWIDHNPQAGREMKDQVVLGPPSPSGTTVPGPLPLLGAGAAFGWSRRLRKRITTPLITPPQA